IDSVVSFHLPYVLLTVFIVLFCVFLFHYLSTFFLFFFNNTSPTEIYTLSLHDALPICHQGTVELPPLPRQHRFRAGRVRAEVRRSEEHTSELQSHLNLVCRLLLEKKKNIHRSTTR